MTENSSSDFGKRLLALIRELGIEQQEFASAGGIGKSTLTGYIKGRSQPSLDVLSNWVRKFDIFGDWLLIGEGPMFRGEGLARVTSNQPETTAPCEAAQTAVMDPMAIRMETVARLLREAEATNEEIRRALLAMAGAGESSDTGAGGGTATG